MKRRSPVTRPRASKRLDADVVEVGGAVHGRDRVGLGHDQRGRLARLAPHLALEQRRCCGRGRPAPVRSRPRPERATGTRRSTDGAALEAVLAVAEEREVVVGQPVEERGGLVGLRAADARHLGRHASAAIARARCQHPRPVLDGETRTSSSVASMRARTCSSCAAIRRCGPPRCAARIRAMPSRRVARRLEQAAGPVAPHREHRVHHRVDREPAAVQHHRERIDQERHVVGDDLDHRARRLPAVVRDGRG